MNKTIFVCLLSWITFSSAFPQSSADYRHPDAIARAVPDSASHSVNTLSGYFSANLHSAPELARAFYSWTANEIAYDADNMFTYRPSDDPGKIIQRTIIERKAVCQGYAEVFHELCEDAGLESYVVPGYTRQNGSVVTINHAWVVARIDTSWYCFDPTWGSGVLINGKYIRRFSNDYFMVKPSFFIKSHMPFDPLWQCLACPLNSADFYRGVFPKKDTCRYFSFPDSIKAYIALAKADRFSASLRRVVKNGVNNNCVFEYERFLQQNIEIEAVNRNNELQNQKINQYNDAVNHFNAASLLFNEYIDYWNRQFKPARPDAAIRKMLDTCNYHLGQSRHLLEPIGPPDDSFRQNKEMLVKAIRDIQKRVDDQSAFLTDYFSTSKMFRRPCSENTPGSESL